MRCCTHCNCRIKLEISKIIYRKKKPSVSIVLRTKLTSSCNVQYLQIFTVYMGDDDSLTRGRNCIHFASTSVHPRCFDGVRVANLFSFLCCPIMYPSVLSSVLWCPLRFPHENDVRFALPPVVCRREDVLFTLFYVCLRIVVSHTYCVVFFLSFFVCLSSSCVLCTQSCQFLFIIHSWLPLRFSHRFI